MNQEVTRQIGKHGPYEKMVIQHLLKINIKIKKRLSKKTFDNFFVILGRIYVKCVEQYNSVEKNEE